MAEIEFGEPEKGGISRRTVTKGIAWAVPAIAIASATPAFAASPEPIEPSAEADTFCQHSNVNRYHGVFCFNNTLDVDVAVTLGSWDIPGGSPVTGLFSVGNQLMATRVIEPGEICLYVDSTVADDMANGAGELHFTYTYMIGEDVFFGSGSVEGEAVGVNCNSTPPQPTGAPPHVPNGP